MFVRYLYRSSVRQPQRFFSIKNLHYKNTTQMSDLITKFNSLNIKSTITLNDEQKALSSQWEELYKTNTVINHIPELNLALRDSVYLIPNATEISELDVKVAEQALPVIKSLVTSSKDLAAVIGAHRHIIRFIRFVLLKLNATDDVISDLNLNVALTKEIIEKKKKAAPAEDKAEAPAAAKADKKKDDKPKGKPDEETLKKLREEAKAKKAAKKEQKAKEQPKEQAAAKPSVSAIDFRVGFIEKCIPHENADSLYVSTIQCGDEEGPRTVCSGLVKHFPLEAMQKRYVVTVCNLKPVNMRGIKSCAMVLCANNADDGKVEFVNPPAGSQPGDKVFFEGYGEEEPLAVLNPKKKIWEAFQPNFSSNENKEIIFKDEDGVKKLVNKKGEVFTVESLVNASVR
ncbi:hypothetical protein ACO0OE_003736 [Hanseniaspora uvarum]